MAAHPDSLEPRTKTHPANQVPQRKDFQPRFVEAQKFIFVTVPPSGGWKAARTRTLESVRYVAQPLQAAGWRSFPAPQRVPACGGARRDSHDAPAAPARLKTFYAYRLDSLATICSIQFARGR